METPDPSHSDCDSDSELMAVVPGSCERSRQLLCTCCRRRGYSLGSQGEAGMEPKDRYNLVYVCMLLAGAGFLFPWTSYITAIDYFFFLYQRTFPEVSVAIPVTYLVTTMLSSTFNVYAVDKFRLSIRIGFGYVAFSISLLFVLLLDIGIHNCTVSTHISFYLTLLSVMVVGLGSGVQQSSYYGLSGMLPRKYAQAVMAGESVAGVVVSINRIITKATIHSERTGAITFFAISLGFVMACFGCQLYILRSPFVRYHMTRCEGKKQKPTQKQEDKGVELQCLEPQEGEGDGKQSAQEEGDSVLQLLERRDEAQLAEEESSDQERLIPVHVAATRHYIPKAVLLRVKVIGQIWRLMVAIFVSYFVTLLVFPGLISEVQYCRIGDWMPVLLITVFNFTDFIAKWLALLPLHWSPTKLMVAALLRVVLVPLLLLCVAPSPSNPVISGVAIWAILFTIILGITNGYFGSLPMINVSAEVDNPEHKELASTILTWILLSGLTLGSVLAYALTPLTKLDDSQLCNSSTVEPFVACMQNSTLD